MNPYDVHAKSIASLVSEMGNSCPRFTWGNSDYGIIPGSAMTRKDLTAGGYAVHFDVQFTALVEDFIAAEIVDAATLKDAMLETLMQYLGDDYKIVSVSLAPGGLQVQIGANASNQGA